LGRFFGQATQRNAERSRRRKSLARRNRLSVKASGNGGGVFGGEQARRRQPAQKALPIL
jgi:hypothetical protein